MHWNTHSRSSRLAGARCGVFSIVLIGNQIAESARKIDSYPRQYARVQIVQFGASRHLTGRFGVAGASFVAAEARPPMNGNIPGASGIWAVKFGWSGIFA